VFGSSNGLSRGSAESAFVPKRLSLSKQLVSPVNGTVVVVVVVVDVVTGTHVCKFVNTAVPSPSLIKPRVISPSLSGSISMPNPEIKPV